jgi:hypothetical protein
MSEFVELSYPPSTPTLAEALVALTLEVQGLRQDLARDRAERAIRSPVWVRCDEAQCEN